MLDDRFKVTIPGFGEHEYCHKLEYQIQNVTPDDNDDEKCSLYRPPDTRLEVFEEQSIVECSPFYIQNLWPFETYRIRVRYWNTLFTEHNQSRDGKTTSKYRWSPWHYQILRLAPLDSCGDDEQKELEWTSSSTVKEYSHEQLCEWIDMKFFGNGSANDCTIWSSVQEKEQLFRIVLRVLRKSPLKGADIVIIDPSIYVSELLMPVYREMIAASNDDEQKQFTGSCSERDPEIEALRQSIIGLIQEQDFLNVKIEDSISNEELKKILKMNMVESLLVRLGISPKEIRERIFGQASSRPSGIAVVEEQDFESVMWRLRQSAFRETEHPVGALIDNPYCIYIWAYFRKKPNLYYTVQQINDAVYIPLRPCLDSSEVHLYYGKYFARSNPSELDIIFTLCEGNENTGKFALLKVDGEWVRFNSDRRRHVVIRVYNEGIEVQQPLNIYMQRETPREDCVTKVKDMKDWKTLNVHKAWGFGRKKDLKLPYFECLLQFCFTNIGEIVPLSAGIDVIESMVLMQTMKGKKEKSLEMITDKLEAQQKWISSFDDHND